MILWRGEGAKAVASTHGERPGSTHKVVEVQCSRNTTLDPEHAAPQRTPGPSRAGPAYYAATQPLPLTLAPYPLTDA